MNESSTSIVSRQSSQPSASSTAEQRPPVIDNPVEVEPCAPDPKSDTFEELPAREPPFALLSDGRLVVSINALENRDLRGLDVWTGVILSPTNAEFVMHRAENAALETAAHLAARYPAAPKTQAT